LLNRTHAAEKGPSGDDKAVQRAALAAGRSMEVLSYLAANPSQKYTLTELARGLAVSPSSMYGILGVMTQAGFLVRHPIHKTYSLGPMAVVVGHGALGQNPQIDLARSELSRVANAQDLKSAIVAVIGHEIVTVGRDGPLTGQHLTFVGQREPHEPPFGSIFVAWAAPEVATTWLSRAQPPLDAARVDQYRQALGAIRDEGRTILVAQHQLLRFAVTSIAATDENSLLVPFESIEAAYVHYIGVPIFDAFGAVSLGLFVDELPAHLGIGDIEELAKRLQAAARNVMTRTGGQPPDSPGE